MCIVCDVGLCAQVSPPTTPNRSDAAAAAIVADTPSVLPATGPGCTDSQQPPPVPVPVPEAASRPTQTEEARKPTSAAAMADKLRHAAAIAASQEFVVPRSPRSVPVAPSELPAGWEALTSRSTGCVCSLYAMLLAFHLLTMCARVLVCCLQRDVLPRHRCASQLDMGDPVRPCPWLYCCRAQRTKQWH